MTRPVMVQVGRVARFIRGITFKPTDIVAPYSDGSVVCMRTKNVQADLDQKDLLAIPKSFVKRKEQYLHEGDILVSSANSWDLVGKCSWVPLLRYEATAGGFISIFRGNKQKVDARYLFYWLGSPSIQHELRLCGRQTTNISNLSFDRALELEIPLPPLPEQNRIAAILDKADAIRRKRQAAIKLTDDFLRSTFLDMFGDPVTNPKGWDVVPLKKLGYVTTGNTPSRANLEFYGNDIEWIKSDNINTPYHYLTQATESLSSSGKQVARTVPPWSTFVTCIAGSFDCIGNAAITDREVSFNQQINAITPRRNTDPYFLYVQILNAKKIIQSASTNSMKGMVSKGNFEQIMLLQPPEDLQKEFGIFFEKYLKATTTIRSFEDISSDLFNSLTQRAFRGEL